MSSRFRIPFRSFRGSRGTTTTSHPLDVDPATDVLLTPSPASPPPDSDSEEDVQALLSEEEEEFATSSQRNPIVSNLSRRLRPVLSSALDSANQVKLKNHKFPSILPPSCPKIFLPLLFFCSILTGITLTGSYYLSNSNSDKVEWARLNGVQDMLDDPGAYDSFYDSSQHEGQHDSLPGGDNSAGGSSTSSPYPILPPRPLEVPPPKRPGPLSSWDPLSSLPPPPLVALKPVPCLIPNSVSGHLPKTILSILCGPSGKGWVRLGGNNLGDLNYERRWAGGMSAWGSWGAGGLGGGRGYWGGVWMWGRRRGWEKEVGFISRKQRRKEEDEVIVDVWLTRDRDFKGVEGEREGDSKGEKEGVRWVTSRMSLRGILPNAFVNPLPPLYVAYRVKKVSKMTKQEFGRIPVTDIDFLRGGAVKSMDGSGRKVMPMWGWERAHIEEWKVEDDDEGRMDDEFITGGKGDVGGAGFWKDRILVGKDDNVTVDISDEMKAKTKARLSMKRQSKGQPSNEDEAHDMARLKLREGWDLGLMVEEMGSRVGLELVFRRSGSKASSVPLPPWPLTFSSSGSFTVLQIADLHFSTGPGPCRDVTKSTFAHGPPEETQEQTRSEIWESCVRQGGDQTTLDWLERAIDEVGIGEGGNKAGIVVLSGDQINGQETSWDAKSALLKIATVMWRRKLPWAAVFGNHDDEDNLSRADLMKIMMRLPYFVGQVGPQDKNGLGVGNYMLSIHSPDPTYTPLLNLYFLDSHAYADRSKSIFDFFRTKPRGYDHLKPSQIEWYRSTSNKIKPILRPFQPPNVESNSTFGLWPPESGSLRKKRMSARRLDPRQDENPPPGTQRMAKPNAMAFFHIPLPESLTEPDKDPASGQPLKFGNQLEAGGAPEFNSHFFDDALLALREDGPFVPEVAASQTPTLSSAPPEVKVVSNGHSHLSSSCQQSHGIWLCFAGGSSYSGYGSEKVGRGVRIYEVSQWGETIETSRLVDDGRGGSGWVDEWTIVGEGAPHQRR